MRYRLLASAGLTAIALSLGFALTTANAEDCGCRDRVRAALARQAPVVPKPAPSRARPCCASAPSQDMVADAGAPYDYRAQSAVDMYPYRHRWEVAPQGYVPPPQGYGPPMESYGPAEGAPMGYAPPMPYGPNYGMAYGQPYGEGWAYDYRPAITIDQGGWFGGVGYAGGGDGGGGGGGGGMTLSLAQPDASNGPSYNSFGQSYGGSYGAANQNNVFRAEAFAPKK